MWAADAGRTSTTQALLQLGAKMNMQNKEASAFDM